jgi:hypothetical protein
MSRTRLISPDFWTREAVVDCTPMARLLFLGLQTFADDFGVQPLRPRTIKMQVFPGDAIDADAVRALIEELASHGLVRLYSVAGQDYIAIVDWEQRQRVGKRARRRYPDIGEADQRLTPGADSAETRANQSNPPPADRMENHSSPPLGAGQPAGQIQDCLTHARGDTGVWRYLPPEGEGKEGRTPCPIATTSAPPGRCRPAATSPAGRLSTK